MSEITPIVLIFVLYSLIFITIAIHLPLCIAIHNSAIYSIITEKGSIISDGEENIVHISLYMLLPVFTRIFY